MKRTRLALRGFAVIASLASLAFVSACVTKPVETTPTPTAKPALQVLQDAAAKTKGQSFKYTLVYGEILTGDGSRDATGNTTRNATVKTGANGLSIAAKLLHVGDQVFAKLDLGSFGALVPGLANVGDRWLIVDASKVNPNGLSASLIPNPDSSTVDSFVTGVVTAENVSATEVKGTVDLTKASPIALPASELAKLSAEQKIVPFTAAVDGEGRVTKLVVNLPAFAGYPAAPLTTVYSDFGATITITAPTADQTVAAPETIYVLLP